jgi:hypothetical protein
MTNRRASPGLAQAIAGARPALRGGAILLHVAARGKRQVYQANFGFAVGASLKPLPLWRFSQVLLPVELHEGCTPIPGVSCLGAQSLERLRCSDVPQSRMRFAFSCGFFALSISRRNSGPIVWTLSRRQSPRLGK